MNGWMDGELGKLEGLRFCLGCLVFWNVLS